MAHPNHRFAAHLASIAVGLGAACAPSHTSGSGTSIIVGIQAEELAGEITSVHYLVKVAGQPDVEATFAASELPKEVPLTATSDPNAQIDVRVDGLLNAAPLATRLASTHFVQGQTELLRIRLEQRCAGPIAGGGPPGPACTAPQTCIAGHCVDDAVPAASLEPYETNWATDPPDVCKPANHGDPVVILGTGQNDFLPIVDGQTLTLEKGPQGGHHVWIAARTKNLRQTGTTTTVSGTQPGSGLTVPPTSVVFTFNPDEGGYCKVYGITFRLDDPSDLLFFKNFLGKPLDVSVVVKDASGASATAGAHVNIAPLLVCPPGDTDPVCQK